LADFADKAAVAIRLRTATDSLTDPRDWKIAREYIRELETTAWWEESADRTAEASGPDEPPAVMADDRFDPAGPQ